MNSSNLQNATNYLCAKMPSNIQNHPNPIETLTVDDIIYLQAYLEQIKRQKMGAASVPRTPTNRPMQIPPNRATDIYDPLGREVPVDWRTFRSAPSPPICVSNEPGSRGAACTRTSKRSQQNCSLDQVNDYHNPYEYGARQNTLPPTYMPQYHGPYDRASPTVLNQMGVAFGGNDRDIPFIRNVNVESSLMQSETTHLPGQRGITEKEIDRFERLPFDPQDHRHIVWRDNMPRGGYATRNERLEN